MESKEIQLSTELDIPPEELEIVPIHSLCRLCATQNERLIGLYSEEGVTNDLANKINLYLPVKVSIGDELPLQCCWSCASTILAWHELVLASVEADRKFRSLRLPPAADIIDHGGFEAVPSVPTDDDMMHPVPIATSLNDFCPADATPLNTINNAAVAKKSPRSTKKKKKHEPLLYKPQPLDQLDPYMSDIDHHLINPELVDNPELSDYKMDLNNHLLDEDDDVKSDDVKDFGGAIKDGDNEKEDEESYFSCQYCPGIFIGRNDVVTHVRNDHGKDYDVSFVQPVPKEAPDGGVKKERRKNNKIDQDLISSAKVVVDGRIYYNCKECGKSLHSPYTFVWHMRIHTGERPYVCDLCGKQFRVSQGLVRHLRETHQGIKKFPCDLCGRMFATRRNVEEHRRIHTNERPYVCDLCGKSFKQKASLFVHKRSHKNYFPFKCSYCNQGFRTKPPLMVHITRHTGEKPYKCDICGRCFRIKYELKRHRLIHSDEKPWVCSICGLSFRQKRYLRNHTKSNHTLVAG